MKVWELDIEKTTVKRWSFCESCSGRGCSRCDYTCREVERVPLSEIPRLLRQDYVDFQEDFIQRQLKKG